MINLDYFDLYVEMGLRPIAVYKNSKCPIGDNWNNNWSIERWRPFFYSEDVNFGVLLGDIIDVEGDCDKSSNLLNDLIGNVPCLKFKSSKSTHHIFLNPDRKLTRTVIQGIEFRGHKHQTVFPPSVHQFGIQYQFINKVFPITEMPKTLKNFYFNNKQLKKQAKNKSKLKPGYVKTHCNKCFSNFYIHKKRLCLEVQAFSQHDLLWMCHGCREINIKKYCRAIRLNFPR
jgi:hypothetical protein